MLRNLRLKFIALNMAIVTMVLVIAFGAICYLTYSQDLASVRSAMGATLDRLATARNIGYDSSELMPPGILYESFGDLPFVLDEEGGSVSDEDVAPFPEIGGGRMTRAELTPIATYAVDMRGFAISLSSYSTAIIPDAFLSDAISMALNSEENFGTIEGLGVLYERRAGEAISYLAFTDASSVGGWKELALTLAVVGLIAVAGFLVISVFFSRWALRPVEKAWNQQRRFFADASHELKTPLTVIMANNAILRGQGDETATSQSQWIESTQVEAERMQALVNDMLELTQLDSKTSDQGSFSPVDFSDLVETEILQFDSVAFELGLSIEDAVEPKVHVRGDNTSLRRMVRILIDNACKYADKDSVVKVGLRRDSRFVRFEVMNTGAPIAAGDIPHIFDRFYRADESRARETGGHGLGLSIAYEIVRAHKGKIEVASSLKNGTVFTVTLPLG